MARQLRLQARWSEAAEQALTRTSTFFGPDRCATTLTELNELELPWEELSQCCTLVNLYGQRLERVPEQLQNFHKMELLNLGRNKIDTVPAWSVAPCSYAFHNSLSFLRGPL